MIDNAADKVYLPSPEGYYAKAEPCKKEKVWLGGKKIQEISINSCTFAKGSLSVCIYFWLSHQRTEVLAVEAFVSNSAQLLNVLISKVSGSPLCESLDISMDRLIDFIIDQICDEGCHFPRLSKGIGGQPWYSSQGNFKNKILNGCPLKSTGSLFVHPSILLQRVYQNHVLPDGWSQRLDIIKPELYLEPPTIFLDISKPNKASHYPAFKHSGVIISGYRGGLESWAVNECIHQQRPYFQLRGFRDVDRLIHLLPECRLITPHNGNKSGYGKVRANIIQLIKEAQPLKNTA